jgi:hypothetical protein
MSPTRPKNLSGGHKLRPGRRRLIRGTPTLYIGFDNVSPPEQSEYPQVQSKYCRGSFTVAPDLKTLVEDVLEDLEAMLSKDIWQPRAP